MDLLFISARVVHIGLGVFWAGTIIFMATFLTPSVRDAGPDGAKVMAEIMRRRFIDIMPALAALTVISGFYMYWRDSAGFASSYMTSRVGITLGVGAVAALVAFAIGVGVMRPAVLRASALARAAASAPPEERDSTMKTVQALRVRASSAGRTVAWLLAFTTITMAIARYI